MSETNNPFAALVSIPNKKLTNNDTNPADINLDLDAVNNIVECVFHFTINPAAIEKPGTEKQLVYLEELAESAKPVVHIDLELLEQALFERLLLNNIEEYVIPKACKIYQEHVVQKQVIPYLFSSIQNLWTLNQNDQIVQRVSVKIRELIFRNIVTALKQPALFEDQNFVIQLSDLLQHVDPQSHIFFSDIVNEFVSDGSEDIHEQLSFVIQPLLARIHTEINKSNIINLPIYILPAVQLFAGNTHLAPILMTNCEPRLENDGRLYQDSVIGALLSLSVLPKNASAPCQFFDNPLDQASTSMIDSSIWNATVHLTTNLHKVFLSLLKGSPSVKKRILTWIGKCLKANQARGKLWNVQGGDLTASVTCVSDGFMLNLGAVLLQLCKPFSNKHDNPKALKIDPTYAAVIPVECESKSVHLDCLHSETCLLPPKEDENGTPIKRPTAPTYSFVTECFYMTQKCIDLGVRVCAEKLWRCGQELGRAQRTLADANNAAASQLLEPLRQRTQHLMTRFLSLRCSLMESEMLRELHHLQAMTCTWLVQVATKELRDDQDNYAPLELTPLQLPQNNAPPDTLRCVPEFVLENIVVLITMARRTMEHGIEDMDTEQLLFPALELVLTFMGDATRTNNPHLRARLAECLEAMLPTTQNDQPPLSGLASFFRERLFKEHPHRMHLIPALLDVFVGIEMTGQSVQFEQKFNYRRPMYVVMDFLWEFDEHKDAFTRLAREAEKNMEAVHPPLFLRFVNLLMNDAIFLLDEALTNMAQIKTMQTAQQSGEWSTIPPQEREQNLANLSHIGMLARFDNILGKDTVRTLVRLTSLAPYVFCHPTLIDRIASMLNYFLMNLVGPNKKNFKVKDMKEYEFDPASTVLDICRMYVVLGENDNFCGAVSDDGRSYSPQLFQLAEDVLVRIGGGSLIGSLQEFASKVGLIALQRERDELLLANAPDEFLDPIMSTLMMDPVVLPSSRTTVDRTTIARHLLSDQSDPFNRSPLSMDQVKSNTELKNRIQQWIAEKKQNQQASTSQ